MLWGTHDWVSFQCHDAWIIMLLQWSDWENHNLYWQLHVKLKFPIAQNYLVPLGCDCKKGEVIPSYWYTQSDLQQEIIKCVQVIPRAKKTPKQTKTFFEVVCHILNFHNTHLCVAVQWSLQVANASLTFNVTPWTTRTRISLTSAQSHSKESARNRPRGETDPKWSKNLPVRQAAERRGRQIS